MTDGNDEFDAFFDDAPLDPELEESLAQLEASYTASQSVASRQQRQTSVPGYPGRPTSFATATATAAVAQSTSFNSLPSGSIRKGTFVNPQKKQKLGNGPSRITSGGSTGLRHEAVIVEDEDEERPPPAEPPRPGSHASTFIAANNGNSRQQLATAFASRRSPGTDQVIVRNLRDDEFGDGDDDWWTGNNGLDRAEEEAIRMSQQPVSQQPRQQHQQQQRQPAQVQSRRNPPPEPRPPPPQDVTNAYAGSDTDVELLQRQLQDLQRAAKQHEETIRKLTLDKRAKEGEVAVVRQNLSKVSLDNAKLREKEVRMEQEHKASLEKLHADNQRQMERLETATAFRRVEQDTSRRAWPSSVRRLPPSTLRDADRRQESQVAAGLTTPTKRKRNGRQPITPSSSTSWTPRTLGRPALMDRGEPSSPSKKATPSNTGRDAPVRYRSSAKGKAKAFSKFQNSFNAPETLPANFRPAALIPGLKPIQAEGGESRLGGLSQDAIDITMGDHEEPLPDRASPSRLPQTPSKQRADDGAHVDGIDAAAYRRRERYHWAVGELVRRRAELVGQVLGHTCSVPSTPLSYPRTRYNPKGSLAGVCPSGSRPYETTIYRLINAEVPSSVAPILLQRYALTTQFLNTVLTQGSVSDGEQRFYFLLVHDDGGWEEELEDGMQDLLEGLAAALQTLMGLFLRLCMIDCLRDTLKLTWSLCVAHPALADKILTPQDDVWTHRTAELRMHEASHGSDGPRRTTNDDVDTPRSLTGILVESIKKCNVVPISISSPASVLPLSGPLSDAADRGRPATTAQAHAQSQMRRANRERARTANGEMAATPKEEPWDMGGEAREELIEAVISMLEVLCWSFSGRPLESALRFVGETDGFLYTLLDRRRRCSSIERTVRLMASMASNSSLIHACLAAKPDPQLGQSLSTPSSTSTSTSAMANARRGARSARFSVLEVLSKHLVDRRVDLSESEWHSLHRTILILLTQAAIKARDTHIILADSAPLLAALIKCLSLDSDTLWNAGAQGIVSTLWLDLAASRLDDEVTTLRNGEQDLETGLEDLVERLTLDVRLLSVLYRYPLPLSTAGENGDSQYSHPDSSADAYDGSSSRWGLINLAQKLEDPEAYNMLNGIRQSFIVSLNRIAFAPEPEWIEDEKEMALYRLRRFQSDTSDKVNAVGGATVIKRQVEARVRRLTTTSARLDSIADLAGDLVDLVLSPDEVNEIFELLADDEDEGAGEGSGGGGGDDAYLAGAKGVVLPERGNDMDEDEEAIVAEVHPIHDDAPRQHAMIVDRPVRRQADMRTTSRSGSETETEPDEDAPSASAPALATRLRTAAKQTDRPSVVQRRNRQEVVEIHDTDSEPDRDD